MSGFRLIADPLQRLSFAGARRRRTVTIFACENKSSCRRRGRQVQRNDFAHSRLSSSFLLTVAGAAAAAAGATNVIMMASSDRRREVRYHEKSAIEKCV